MVFDVDKYAYVFKTEPDKAYFWHGYTTENWNKYPSSETATLLAKENGGKTIGMCMLEHRKELEKVEGFAFRDIRDEQDNTIDTIIYSDYWKECSALFAEQASRVIHVVEGADPRFGRGKILFWREKEIPESEYRGKDSCWARIERPILTAKNNDKVHIIVSHDAITGREQGIIFDRETEKRLDFLRKEREKLEAKGANIIIIDERIRHIERSYEKILELEL